MARYIASGNGGVKNAGSPRPVPKLPSVCSKSPSRPMTASGRAEEIVIARAGAPNSDSIALCTSPGSRPASGASRIESRLCRMLSRRSSCSAPRAVSLASSYLLHAPDRVPLGPQAQAIPDRAVGLRLGAEHLEDAALPRDRRAGILGRRQRSLAAGQPRFRERADQPDLSALALLEPILAKRATGVFGHRDRASGIQVTSGRLRATSLRLGVALERGQRLGKKRGGPRGRQGARPRGRGEGSGPARAAARLGGGSAAVLGAFARAHRRPAAQDRKRATSAGPRGGPGGAAGAARERGAALADGR